jgi:formate dehydrogenase major subunit
VAPKICFTYRAELHTVAFTGVRSLLGGILEFPYGTKVTTMFSLPVFSRAQPSREPFSPQTAAKSSRLRGADVTESVCPYCAVGCGQLIYTKGGKVINIEGDPRSPINEGTLCPKGADAFQLAVNPHRVTHVMYRAPFSDKWETRPLEWAMDRIARRVKEVRDADFTAQSESGQRLNSLRSIGSLGGATLDIEENYLIKKLFGAGLGMVAIENQART